MDQKQLLNLWLRWYIFKLVTSTYSASLITTVSTHKLLLITQKSQKPITSGLNLKSVNGSQRALSDSASLFTRVYSLKLTLFHLKSQKTDNFRFKPEVLGRGKISLVQANSEGSINLVGLLKMLFLAFHQMKTDNFRFKPEVRGRISKMMISLD